MSLPNIKRQTISLCMIVKNEEKNLPRLFNSIEGCFDELIIVDTGSTDKTKLLALEYGAKIFDFKWINNFAAARNFAFSKATSDFILWLDGDDTISNKEAFIQWKTHAMQFADLHYAGYNYALDKNGKPIISFVRERVFRRSINPVWQYAIHEGVILKHNWRPNYALTWSVNHHRDAEDIKADKNRNITILEEIKASIGLDARLKFYYGKELYESDKSLEALQAFDDALKDNTLERHDRLLSYQYASYASINCADQLKDNLIDKKNEYYQRAINYCHDGIKLDPNRAEYHVSCGDIYVKMGALSQAVPYYHAAKGCINPKEAGSPYEGAIYNFVDCYGENPRLQLSKIYFNLGKIDLAKKEAQECIEKFNNQEAKTLLEELNRISALINLDNNQEEVEDIVFTGPPQSAYEFDEELYKTKPMGGSETALICVAKHLKELTGRPVKVFAMREKDLVAESGVEYLSNKNVVQYFSKYKPKIHIAWRHNITMTKAKTYVWCHDLYIPTVESKQEFDKIMPLTHFHKNYIQATQGVPDSKIYVTRNGITPEKFDFDKPKKNPNKVVWMSSPDRGLDRCMLVCDEVKKEYNDLELHVYYGLENLYKYGMSELGDKLKAMIKERPYVKLHGFTEQNEMYRQVADAAIWLYPSAFIETFCITAIEMLSLSIYPVAGILGSLGDVLKKPYESGMASLVKYEKDYNNFNEKDVLNYASLVKEAIAEKKWERISFDKEANSWKSVSQEWIKEMDL